MSEITAGSQGVGSSSESVPTTGQGSGAVSTPDTAYSGGNSAPQDRQRVNLEELPEFREYKTKVNQTFAERDRAAREAERKYQQQVREWEERAKQVEQELEKRVVSNLDEYGQMEYRAQQEAKKREQLERKLNEVEMERSKNEYMTQLRARYGIDPEDDSHPVMALQSVAEALYKKSREMEQELEKYKKEAMARKAALDDAPDLGGGTPVHGISDMQRRFNDAMVNKRSSEADRIAREASVQGVQIDRFAWLKERK